MLKLVKCLSTSENQMYLKVLTTILYNNKRKRQSDPVTGPVWPRGWVEVQLYSSMTTAPEGGEWSAARPGLTLLLGKTRYPFYRRVVRPQGRSGREEKLVPTGIRSRTVQTVAQSLYRLSYPAHNCLQYFTTNNHSH